MNYLEIVGLAMQRAGVREDTPSTLVDATGITEDFAQWVADEYRALQVTGHGDRWFWRQSIDETISLADGDFDYSLPAGIQDVNWNTARVYTTARTDETMLYFVDYYDFKMNYRTVSFDENRPRYVTMTPAGEIWVSPTPDQAYTMAFDGIMSVDSMPANADAARDAYGDLGEILVPEDYQFLLVWGAVKRFAKHHEDAAKLADAQSEYRPIYDSMINRQTPNVRVVVGQLYGTRRIYGA